MDLLARLRTGRPELDIYLNDHLTGATGGVELIRRMADTHRGTDRAPAFARLAAEISEDRDALLGFMAALGVPARAHRIALGWAAERVGRLKTNGRLVTRSPLSDVLELEAMSTGVYAKSSLWHALRTLADHDVRLDAARLDVLLGRAADQVSRLEELHRASVPASLKPAVTTATD
ncbi:MAG: hypothetical protein M3Q39_11090 [Actinomycetota bacterium]|nr:hypothetical protein [Actinomycetota bacterium]